MFRLADARKLSEMGWLLHRESMPEEKPDRLFDDSRALVEFRLMRFPARPGCRARRDTPPTCPTQWGNAYRCAAGGAANPAFRICL